MDEVGKVTIWPVLRRSLGIRLGILEKARISSVGLAGSTASSLLSGRYRSANHFGDLISAACLISWKNLLAD
jgi:hypothetical protein